MERLADVSVTLGAVGVRVGSFGVLWGALGCFGVLLCALGCLGMGCFGMLFKTIQNTNFLCYSKEIIVKSACSFLLGAQGGSGCAPNTYSRSRIAPPLSERSVRNIV